MFEENYYAAKRIQMSKNKITFDGILEQPKYEKELKKVKEEGKSSESATKYFYYKNY